jgi:hypothetical protein
MTDWTKFVSTAENKITSFNSKINKIFLARGMEQVFSSRTNFNERSSQHPVKNVLDLRGLLWVAWLLDHLQRLLRRRRTKSLLLLL